MKTRNEIQDQIKIKREQISQLCKEIDELLIDDYLLNDSEQWFTEKEETIGRGKKKETHLVGRIHWNQEFMDESTGEKFPIERSEIVRFDGVWRIS